MGTLNMHRRIAGWFGYELVKRRKLNDTLEQHLANVLRDYRINLLIDVGANTGQFASAMRAIGYDQHIESFEPVQEAFDELEQLSDGDPNWICSNVALGSRNGTVTLQRCAATEFSSLLPINEYARQRFKWRADLDGTEAVQMMRLSDGWPNIKRRVENPRVMLKLDTQGYDLEVLAGADLVLPHTVVIQIELSLKSIYDGAPRYLDALREFENLGFEISGLYPVSRDKKTLAVIEYDCVMVRT